LNNVCHAGSRHFTKKEEISASYKLETNSKNKNIGDIYMDIGVFKKGYQTRINIVTNWKGDLVADSKSILPRWRKLFSQLLNVHGVKVVGHT
jgi:hypothetical protein